MLSDSYKAECHSFPFLVWSHNMKPMPIRLPTANQNITQKSGLVNIINGIATPDAIQSL